MTVTRRPFTADALGFAFAVAFGALGGGASGALAGDALVRVGAIHCYELDCLDLIIYGFFGGIGVGLLGGAVVGFRAVRRSSWRPFRVLGLAAALAGLLAAVIELR